MCSFFHESLHSHSADMGLPTGCFPPNPNVCLVDWQIRFTAPLKKTQPGRFPFASSLTGVDPGRVGWFSYLLVSFMARLPFKIVSFTHLLNGFSFGLFST